MIRNPEAARQVSDLMRDIFDRICSSLKMVEETCNTDEYAAYKKATGRIAAPIVFEVMQPLYKQNPSLKPPNWDDDLEDIAECPIPNP
jgi:hypothetical protein